MDISTRGRRPIRTNQPGDDRKSTTSRRLEQVRHLVRSVGVEMDGDVRVPFFVEPTPGKFRQNPAVRTMAIEDYRLCTLTVPSETPAKIPANGLPIEALRYLIEIGLKGTDL